MIIELFENTFGWFVIINFQIILKYSCFTLSRCLRQAHFGDLLLLSRAVRRHQLSSTHTSTNPLLRLQSHHSLCHPVVDGAFGFHPAPRIGWEAHSRSYHTSVDDRFYAAIIRNAAANIWVRIDHWWVMDWLSCLFPKFKSVGFLSSF